MEHTWNHISISWALHHITEFSLLWPYIELLESYTLYILLLYTLILSILLPCILIVHALLQNKKHRKLRQWGSYFIRKFVFSVSGFCFIPVFQFMLSVLACSTRDGEEEGEQLYHASFREVQCWNGFHVLHALCAALFAGVLLAFALFARYVCFETRNLRSFVAAR
jgi:hypothetical protein